METDPSQHILDSLPKPLPAILRYMNLTTLKRSSKAFQAVIGLSPQKFDQLVHELEPRWNQAEYRRKTSYDRKVPIGGGNHYKLSFEQMMALYLVYLRTYVTHIFLGSIFSIHDSRICRYFKKLQPVLQTKMKKLVITKIDLTEQEILDLIVDATEQETERRPGSGYSGKKKKNTIKTQIVVNKKGKIKHVSGSVPGNIHDKKLFDQTKLRLPPQTKADLGYAGTGLKIPHKSSKLHPLTMRQKQTNKRHAKKRIVVEHTFANLKKFQLLAQRYRGKLTDYNAHFVAICGLRNFITA